MQFDVSVQVGVEDRSQPGLLSGVYRQALAHLPTGYIGSEHVLAGNGGCSGRVVSTFVLRRGLLALLLICHLFPFAGWSGCNGAIRMIYCWSKASRKSSGRKGCLRSREVNHRVVQQCSQGALGRPFWPPRPTLPQSALVNQHKTLSSFELFQLFFFFPQVDLSSYRW